jgi:hypothetical protein
MKPAGPVFDGPAGGAWVWRAWFARRKEGAEGMGGQWAQPDRPDSDCPGPEERHRPHAYSSATLIARTGADRGAAAGASFTKGSSGWPAKDRARGPRRPIPDDADAGGPLGG